MSRPYKEYQGIHKRLLEERRNVKRCKDSGWGPKGDAGQEPLLTVGILENSGWVGVFNGCVVPLNRRENNSVFSGLPGNRGFAGAMYSGHLACGQGKKGDLPSGKTSGFCR